MRRDDAWLQTYTGRKVYPLALTADQVDFDDIAHALANINRFTGHTSRAYSVAQHSVLVSVYCAPQDALWGLMHDASEYVLHDIPRPLKRHPSFAFYREAEKFAMMAICLKFGLPFKEPDSVRLTDHRMLATEKRDLMSPPPDEWEPLPAPFARTIAPWHADLAEHMFRSRFRALTQNPEIATADALAFAQGDAWGGVAA